MPSDAVAQSSTALPFAIWLVWLFIKGNNKNTALFDAEQAVAPGTFKAPWFEPILWIAGLYLLSILIGFIPAIMLFFITFFTLKAKTSLIKTAILTASGVGLLLLFGYFLNLEFPQGLF